MKQIVDFIRIPVDEDGSIIYNLDTARQIGEQYKELFPDHSVFIMPADLSIWQNLDLTSLKIIRDFLDDIIKKEELN